MTIKELIDALEKLPPKYQNAQIFIWGEQDLEEVDDININDNQIILLTEHNYYY